MTLFISGWIVVPLCVAAAIVTLGILGGLLAEADGDELALGISITTVVAIVGCLMASMFVRGAVATYREMTTTPTKEAP